MWKDNWWWQRIFSAIALSYLPRVMVRATVKLSAAFFHDESLITKGGGYESALALNLQYYLTFVTHE